MSRVGELAKSLQHKETLGQFATLPRLGNVAELASDKLAIGFAVSYTPTQITQTIYLNG
jgi:hypothetical protein